MVKVPLITPTEAEIIRHSWQKLDRGCDIALLAVYTGLTPLEVTQQLDTLSVRGLIHKGTDKKGQVRYTQTTFGNLVEVLNFALNAQIISVGLAHRFNIRRMKAGECIWEKIPITPDAFSGRVEFV